MRWTLVLVFALSLLLVGCTGKYVELERSCHGDNLTTYQSCVNRHAEENGRKFCEVVSRDSRDLCYLQAAIGENRPKTCRSIDDGKIENNCYGSIALFNEEIGVVRQIDDSDRRYEWYTTIALRTNRTDVCRKILDDEDAHGSCLYQLAKRSNDPDMCYFIDRNTLYRDACYFHMARTYDNSTFCIGVEGGILKTKCETVTAKVYASNEVTGSAFTIFQDFITKTFGALR